MLVFLPVLILGLAGCLPLSALPYSEPTPVFVNHVAEEISGLTQLWCRNDVYILQDNKTLDVSMGVGCFLGDLDKAVNYDQIFCFDNETGEVKWQRESFLNGKLAASPEGLFVVYTSTRNTLSRYDLQGGKLIWQKKWFESNPIALRLFNNQIQLVTWKPGRDLWVFDTDGKELKRINNTDAVLVTPDVTYVSGPILKAMKTDTNEVLWEHDTGSSAMSVFTQGKILCRSESESGMVYALDRATGKLLWQVNDIVYSSSIAHSPKKELVYALRNDGDLLAINENTGEASTVVKFSSTPFLFIVAGTAQAYELAYDQEKHILLVSLGDGHQLFAFKEK